MTIQQTTIGHGCFWSMQAIFRLIRGVIKVEAGYMGGLKPNPTYMEVFNGDTGYTEVVNITYDADELSFDTLLHAFFETHNLTVVKRSGDQPCTQYRSVIFYHDISQLRQAQAMIEKMETEKVYDNPILTTVDVAGEFYAAEDRHQNYFFKNPKKPYCAVVIQPKLNKFVSDFIELLKPEYNRQVMANIPKHPLLSKEVLQSLRIFADKDKVVSEPNVGQN